jgi:hypothetical protein
VPTKTFVSSSLPNWQEIIFLRQSCANHSSRVLSTPSPNLDLVNSRYHGGVASGLDVAQEETLLYHAHQLTLLNQQRKQFEDAIAVLLGDPLLITTSGH